MSKEDAQQDEGSYGRNQVLNEINSVKTSSFHYKTWLISGMGFFTDAYDLFIIGTVLGILPLVGWHITTAQEALIGSTSLLSAVIGATVFGRLLDRIGRKAIYGVELIMLIAGSLGSAFLTPYDGVYYLIAWRFMLGIGIGGDYATSSVIMAEYSNTKRRGRFLGMVFSMQSLGLVAGPLIALAFLIPGAPLFLTWRMLLAIGAIPSAIVIYFRRKLPETPKYLLGVKGDVQSASRSFSKFSGTDYKEVKEEKRKIVKLQWKAIFTDRRLALTLLATAGAWFLMDWSFYGNSIMGGSIYGALVPSGLTGLHDLITKTEYKTLIFGIGAVPGYWIATFTIDRIGRKTIQSVGFAMMAVLFGVIAFDPSLAALSYLSTFLIIYGMSYFFVEFGPNTTTFIYPPEVFPVTVRGLGTGLSAAGGKIGAFMGVTVDAFLFASVGGVQKVMMVSTILSIVGLLLTVMLLPETKQKDLEEASQESRYLADAS